MPFWRRKKSVWHEYGHAYELRPTVPVESIYPIINSALDLAFRFSSFGAQLAYTGGTDWDRAAEEFEKELQQLVEVQRALEAVGIAVSEKHMMVVHVGTEIFLKAWTLYHYEDARATQARMKGDERAFRQPFLLSEQHRHAAAEAKSKLALVVRQLHDLRLDQFDDLGMSENNLIDLGLEDLVEQ